MLDSRLAESYLNRLKAALWERGLEAGIRTPALTAKNPAIKGQGSIGAVMCPGLSQKVMIRDLEGRGLTWCWVWNPLRPAERGAATPEPEIEPMCEAADIAQAAYLIANVVRLRDEHSAADGDDV